MGEATWTLDEATSRLSEVIDRARSDGPQAITREGRTTAIVVAVTEEQRMPREGESLADFFAASPLRGSGADFSRSDEGPREIEL